jgi:hypothetical protein
VVGRRRFRRPGIVMILPQMATTIFGAGRERMMRGASPRLSHTNRAGEVADRFQATEIAWFWASTSAWLRMTGLDPGRQAVSCQNRTRQPREANMPAYFVVELDITNQAAMEPYRAAVGATIEQYRGRFLARGGAHAKMTSRLSHIGVSSNLC